MVVAALLPQLSSLLYLLRLSSEESLKVCIRFIHDTCVLLFVYVSVCVHVCVYMAVDPTIWSHLQSRFEREQDSNIHNVMDGTEYKKHAHFLSQPANVSLLLNTDGADMFKSSNISLWPIWVAINELPPHIRYVRFIVRNAVISYHVLFVHV